MKRFQQHHSIETLEQKRMNAADFSLIGGLLGSAPATVQASGAAAGNVNATAADAAAGQNVAASSHLTATLSGTGQGNVNLTSGLANGSTRANFMVHLSGAPANQTFDVSVGGTVVGSISTDAKGNGILHLNTALNNADNLLAALPSITADTAISVGIAGETPILTGTLHAAANVNAGIAGVTSSLTGTLPKLHSVIHNLGDNVDDAIDQLMNVTDKVDNLANRLLTKVDNLADSVVDKVFA